jgi:hypothetical protein
MSIIAKNEGSGFEPAPGGTFAARCYSMIHIGTIDETIQGKPKRLNKVRITWELPTEKKVFKEEEGEMPIVVSKDFTLSMNEKANLRKFLESWRGKQFTEDEVKAFDITKLLGLACLITIVHKKNGEGKEYADIASCSALPKGMVVDAQINPTFEFNYNEPFDVAKYESLPDWLKKKIATSEEYKQATQAATPLSAEQEKAIATEGEQLLDAMEKSVEDDLPF